ncbi:MAG TPA: TRAP transporter fused permease subunit [Xanthobacteraceae bacterium]|jgi:TRAP transporter 4TM/12TM fusion protein
MSIDRPPSAAEIKAAQDALAHAEGESIGLPADPVHKLVVSVFGALLTVLCLAWVTNVPYYFGTAFYQEQFLAVILGLALALAFNAVDWHGKPHAKFSLVDAGLGALALGTAFWIAHGWDYLLQDVSYRTPEVLSLSAIVVILVLEGLRRCTGWGLLSVIVGFLIYAMVAHLTPDVIRGKPQNPEALLVYLAFDPSALYGSPLVVGSTIVIMFIWLGDVLIRSGGGEFFKDIAIALMGRKRAGPAKICVVGSALFGMISGSAVSNVASVGVFTIPMMKRSGYSARDAGAIEAVGSTGGQLMPPVMGAAAFLMAEFIETPYATIAIAAAIPAVLYYFGLYAQVDLIAGKGKFERLKEVIPQSAAVLREGWHFLIPFALLLFTMFYWEESPEVSAISSALVMFVVGMLRSYKGHRLTVGDLFGTLASTGRSTTDLFMTLAGAGFVIGVLNATGLSFALTLLLVKLAGANLFLLLLFAGVVGIILGMGMPTTAVYILLATLMAPSIVETGVTKLAAHMFVLYFGMLSMITPPVALAAYAAANISKAGVMETGWAACRIGWVKFVLPFMFVLSPTLLMIGSPAAIIYDAVTAFCGVYIATVGIVGYFQREIGPVLRVVMIGAGTAAIIPDSAIGMFVPGLLSALGVLVGGGVLAFEYVHHRRTMLARGAAE